jgi:O-antigen/teichoic acid export membrane protein
VVFGGAAVAMVGGDRWLPAVPLMRILAVAMLCRAVVVLTGQLLDGIGRPALTLRLNAVRLAMLVVTLVPLAARYGVKGVAAGVLLANAAAAVLALRLSAHAVQG